MVKTIRNMARDSKPEISRLLQAISEGFTFHLERLEVPVDVGAITRKASCPPADLPAASAEQAGLWPQN